MKISDLIGDLLVQHNCVVIPSFGGFVATRKPAQIDYDKGEIKPPSKHLTFNQQLINNDGLLVTSWAKTQNLNFENAEKEVLTFAQTNQSKLKAGERITIDRVGALYLNEEGKITFEQDRFFNLLLESYGMGEVKFVSEDENRAEVSRAKKPVSKSKDQNERSDFALPPEQTAPEKPIDTPIVELEQQKEVQKKPTKEEVENTESKEVQPNPSPGKKKAYKKILRYAAAAAVTPLLFYTFWIPATSDVLKSGVIYSNDFNPFESTPKSVYFKDNEISLERDEFIFNDEITRVKKNLPDGVDVFHYPLSEDLYIPVWRSDRKKNEASKSLENSNLKTAKAFHLISGCFGEKSNAESLVQNLKSEGFDAFILDYHKGLHRVSTLQADSRREIKQLQKELKSRGVDSWVLKK